MSRLLLSLLAVSSVLCLVAAPLVAAGPKSASEAVALGDSLREKGDSAVAIDAYTKAIKLDPKCANAYCNRGGIYLAEGDFDKALADLDRAIQLDPNDDIAHTNRGYLHVRKGEIDKAIADCTEAIRLNTREPHGVCQSKHGLPTEERL